MKFLTFCSLLQIALIFSSAKAQDASSLEGTWSSKSNAVFTGPDFYDPVDELLIEPALPGISYSFTSDGFWEQAIYQVSGNPQDPTCPDAVLIYQHGTYEVLSNNSLVLTPIQVDGRQLLSQPCTSKLSVYSRYNQTLMFQSWNVYVDPYHGRYRLDLAQFDGSPVPPLYLSYKPPQMLPTITLNPTADSTPTTVSQKIRRSIENREKTGAIKMSKVDYNLVWWFGASMMFLGATGWYIF